MQVTALFTALLSATAVTAQTLTHSQAISRLDSAGVSVTSSGGCSDQSVSTCTSLEGVREDSIEGTVTLSGACSCSLTVTGGTETGHADGEYSHGNGYKIDFAKDSALNSYITSAFTRIEDRGDGAAQYEAGSGNLYADEGSHWDVTFLSDGS